MARFNAAGQNTASCKILQAVMLMSQSHLEHHRTKAKATFPTSSASPVSGMEASLAVSAA